ncbi:hypothetical protein K1719_029990 [Acacia pycnantha]|nr:hypothetical protein K1719_029990 [Acacia pycnantha]
MGSFLHDLAKNEVQSLVNLVKNEAQYLCCFNSYVENFEQKKEILAAKHKDVKTEFQKGKGVFNFKFEVQEWEREAYDIIHIDTKVKKNLFLGLCPNCWSQYRTGKSFIHFESRESKFQDLLKKLQDENCNMIGLQGLGGTGKTSMAKEVGHKLKESKLIDKFIFLVVSQPPDFKKIRGELARNLDLNLDEVKEELSSTILSRIINMDQKLLIILDDVWVEFDVTEKLGIPFGHQQRAYCGGVPVAIVALARALKNQPISAWKDALKTLEDRALSLINSLQPLKSVQTLILTGLELGDICVLGNLLTLMALWFVSCSIDELPKEFFKLKKLSSLEVEACKIKRKNPFEVIEMCSQLEELTFVCNECVDEEKDAISHNGSPLTLHRYCISSEDVLDYSKKYGLSRCFRAYELSKLVSHATFKNKLVERAEFLSLEGEDGQRMWKTLVPDIVPIDKQGVMNDLIVLHLSSHLNMEYLIDTKDCDPSMSAFVI